MMRAGAKEERTKEFQRYVVAAMVRDRKGGAGKQKPASIHSKTKQNKTKTTEDDNCLLFPVLDF